MEMGVTSNGKHKSVPVKLCEKQHEQDLVAVPCFHDSIADVINKIVFCHVTWHFDNEGVMESSEPLFARVRFQSFQPWA